MHCGHRNHPKRVAYPEHRGEGRVHRGSTVPHQASCPVRPSSNCMRLCSPPQSIGITWLTSTPKDLALQRPPGIPQVLHRHHLRRHNPLRRPVPTLAPHDDARLRDPDAQRVQLHGHHAVVGRAKGRRLGRLLWLRHVGRRHGLRRQRDRGRGLPDRGALCQHHRAHRAHARVHDVLPEAHLG